MSKCLKEEHINHTEGMGSIGAMQKGSKDRYNQEGET